MFQLDEQFLKDIGLDEMPDEQKKPFLEHIYEELELRVGTRLSEGLSNDQLDEFESFVEGDADKTRAWLARYEPNYLEQPTYLGLKQKAPDVEDARLASEYASLRWLEINRPNYRDVVASVLDELKTELRTNREQLLS
jgi:hypothetical protein